MARTRIKMCGLTRQHDVKTAIDLGVDALGLVFYDASARAVSLESAASLLSGLPPFVQTVGLFVNPVEGWVQTVLKSVPLDLLQFHGDETASFCRQFGKPYIKAVQVRPGLDLLQYADSYSDARAVLLDAYHPDSRGGTGLSFDWALIPKGMPLPIVLSGGLDSSNVALAIRAVKPFAVDVSSGVEISKGIKDPGRMAAFVNGVRSSEDL